MSERAIRGRCRPPVDIFGRAGLRFSKDWTSYVVDDAALAALQAEPMLEIEIVPAPKPGRRRPADAPADTEGWIA